MTDHEEDYDEYIEDIIYENLDHQYDTMRDDFLMISSEADALHCIKYYGVEVAERYLPEQYKYLLKEQE